MYTFWHDFYLCCGWLLVITGIAFFVMAAYIVVSALSLKNAAMANVKRLYQPPLASAKNLAATGKGIALQESARAQVIGSRVALMAESVKDTAADVGAAAKTIHPEDVKNAAHTIQSSFSVASTIFAILRDLSKKGPANAGD